MIATFQRNLLQHCCAQHVVSVWPPCCDVLQHVGCCWLNSVTQDIATLLAQNLQAPAKRLQHFDRLDISQLCWAQHIACTWPICCDVLRYAVS